MKSRLLSECGDFLVEMIVLRFHRVVAVRPGIYSLALLLLTLCSSVPLLLSTVQSDPHHLFTATRGQAVSTLDRLERDYPMNLSQNFFPSRLLRFSHFARLLLRAKDGGSIFRPEVWEEVKFLDRLVKDVRVQLDDLDYAYDNLCASDGACYQDELIRTMSKSRVSSMSRGRAVVQFPYSINLKSFEFYFLGQSLGQTELDAKGRVKSAKLAGLLYFLRSGGREVQRWQQELANQISAITSTGNTSSLEVLLLTNQVLQQEYNGTLIMAIQLGVLLGAIAVAVALLFQYTGLTLLVLCVGAATCAGLMGVGLAVLMSCSFSLLQLGILLVMLAMSLLDFLLLEEAWAKLGFLGPETVLKSVGPSLLLGLIAQSCLYGLMAALFPFKAAYLAGVPWTLACILYLPFQLVAFTLWMSWQQTLPVQTKESSSSTCVAVKDVREKKNRIIATAMASLVLWAAYVAIASWGAANLPTRMEPTDFYKPTSHVYQALQMEEQHFSEFLYRIHAVVDQPLDYSDPRVQNDLQKLTEKNPFNPAPDLTESWLKIYLVFLQRSGFLTRKYNTSSPQGFVDCLREVFLKIPHARRFQQDIVFGGVNQSQIVQSRFQIQLVGFRDSVTGRQVLKDLRQFAKVHVPSFKVVFFHFLDPILEVLDQLPWMVMTLAAISSLVLGLAVVIFTYRIWPAICLALGLLGWQLGLLGALFLWGGELNGPSAIALALFFGVGIKHFSSILPWLHSETSPFLPLMISSLSLTLGASSSFIVKAYTLITDKIIFIAFANSFIHFGLLYLILILCRLETLPSFFSKFRKTKPPPPSDHCQNNNIRTTSV